MGKARRLDVGCGERLPVQGRTAGSEPQRVVFEALAKDSDFEAISYAQRTHNCSPRPHRKRFALRFCGSMLPPLPEAGDR